MAEEEEKETTFDYTTGTTESSESGSKSSAKTTAEEIGKPGSGCLGEKMVEYAAW